MKRTNKMVALLLACVMLMMAFLAGCGTQNATSAESGEQAQEETVKSVKIGIILYDYTDIQGKELKNYCDNYLAQNFPVTFEYQTASSSDNEAHLAAVDSLISVGCNAIFSGFDTMVGESVEKCDSAGVYYGILFGEAKSEADQDGNYNEYGNWGTKEQSNLFYSEYFLGGLYQFGADHGYEIGKLYGQAVVDAGLTNVGAISFPVYAFSDGVVISQGFAEVLTAANIATCLDVNTGMLPAQAGFITVGDDTKAYIANYPEMDGIFGLSSGMDMVLPAINEVGRLWTPNNTGEGAMKMATLGYNDSSRKYLEDGTLIIGGTNNYVQSVAYMFAMAFDAVNGHNMKTDETSGFQANGTIGYPTFTSVEELNDMETYMLTTVHNDFTKCSVTAEELKSVMQCYGGSGSWNDLAELVSRSIAQIKEVRG